MDEVEELLARADAQVGRIINKSLREQLIADLADALRAERALIQALRTELEYLR